MVEVLDNLLELGDDLDAAGAIADDGYVFAGGVKGWVPVGGVTEDAFVVFDARVVWYLCRDSAGRFPREKHLSLPYLPSVEVADGGY